VPIYFAFAKEPKSSVANSANLNFFITSSLYNANYIIKAGKMKPFIVMDIVKKADTLCQIKYLEVDLI
jgi:hypothetical protein